MKYDKICCSGYQLARMLGRTQKRMSGRPFGIPGEGIFLGQGLCLDHGFNAFVATVAGRSKRAGTWPEKDQRRTAEKALAADCDLAAAASLRSRTLTAKGLSSSAMWRSNQYSAYRR